MTRSILAILSLAALPLCAQNKRPPPEIGYLYPAGGKAGTTVEVLAGGQILRAARYVSVSGKGVHAELVGRYRMPRNFNGEQRRELIYRIQCRKAELEGRPKPKPTKRILTDRADYKKRTAKPAKGAKAKPAAKAPKPGKRRGAKKLGKRPNTPPKRPRAPGGDPDSVPLPPIPFLEVLPHANARQIEHFMTTVLVNQRRRQLNPQLAEIVKLKVTIDPGTPPGRHEIRLIGPQGITNPRTFIVGRIPEVREFEPNDPGGPPRKSPPPAVPAPPFTLNGQILPGDVDRFRFRAKKGQSLVIQGHGRALVPYLADAVPGWFQMVVALYGPDGRQLAWDDDFRFHPDPVLHFTIPKDGDYEIEVRDSIYRGRQDFVYRIDVAESPFVTATFPLGARQGAKATAKVDGWNLPKKQITLDTRPGPPIRFARLDRGPLPGNPIPYAIGTLPEIFEKEPNNAHPKAQPVTLPVLVNGRIQKPGDLDVFRFQGKAGQQVVVEVAARRLNSPIDSLVRLTDKTGETLAWNDDQMEKDGHLHLGPGLLTHYADSFLTTTLPSDGPWFVTIGDAQNHGGSAFAYRLQISPPLPDFELRVIPSGILASPNGHTPVEVFALRHGGFEGPIHLSLAGAPKGAVLEGATIPAGAHRILATLHLPPQIKPGPLPLHLVGTAKHGTRTITRTATPADNTMQAFLWRHLLPAREWLVVAGPPKLRRPPVRVASNTRVPIPAGGSAELKFILPDWLAKRAGKTIVFEPFRAPKGLKLSPPRVADGPTKRERTLVIPISADKDTPAGTTGNLVIQAFGTRPAQKGKPASRWPMGQLPAIPFKIKSK